MIYKNEETPYNKAKEKAPISTAILTDAQVNKDISYLIRSEAEAQATLEMVRRVVACDHYSVTEKVKVEILNGMLFVEGENE